MSRARTPFTPDQQAQLLPLLPVYATLTLAQKFNLCVPRIEAIREQEGIPAPDRGASPPCYAVVLPCPSWYATGSKDRPTKPALSKSEAILKRYPSLPALVAEGKTISEIAEALGVTRAYAPDLCRALDLTPAKDLRESVVTEHPDLLDALETSKSFRALGKEFGISFQRVQQIAKERGIQKPRAKHPGPPKRETVLTPFQAECLEQHPEILDGDVPATRIDGVKDQTVGRIRKALGVTSTCGNTGVSARIVEVLDRPMTPSEIAEAILPLRAAVIQVTLSLAVKTGKIKRIKYGVYAPLNYSGESP